MTADHPAGHATDLVARNKAPDRRGFLAMTGAALGTAALVPHSGAGSGIARIAKRHPEAAWPAGTAAGGPTPADWAALRSRLSSHDLVRPGQRTYKTAKELFDPRFDSLRPAGIAYCRTARDVAACLSFASTFKVPVRARSGGHSYAGWSSVTGGLVVDVTRMDSFAVPRSGTVRVGTGMGLIDFYQHLAARGLAVPGGSCPTVGIAGLALGGGVGVLSRLYGLTSDALESVQIVTANGSVLTCDSGHHSDLFWACRGGGGGNFGVTTSFTFRTHRLRKLILFFLSWPWSHAARVVDGWQSWAPHAPDALWSNMHLSAAPGGAPQIGVGGTYVGSVAGAAAQLKKLYAEVGSRPSSSFLQQEPYLNAMLVEAGCSELTVPQCLAGPGGTRVPAYAKSDFFTAKLDAAGINALLKGIEQLRHVHGTAGGVGAIAFDAFGGAINRVKPAATAFVHRNSLFLAQYSTSWRSPGSTSGVANQHAWLRSFYASLHPHASGQAYQNYIDPDLTNWRQAYYGQNYARLAAVKAKYDPHGLFSFPQGITP
jgi:FAD/FMN-containing dehydrogenase